MLGQPPEKLKIAATYRVSQPIENFVMRVKIVQQKSPLAELFETEGETRDTNYLISEQKDVKWQEKIFSPRETKFYSEEKNCVTDLHKEYREIVIARENSEETRIFTYTSRDHYYPDKSVLTRDFVTSLSIRNRQALPVAINRKPFEKRYNKKVVETWPSKEQIRDNHCVCKDPTSMYVLVDLSSNEELAPDANIFSADSQILLCTITHDRAGKTLTVDPDFNDQHYTVEAAGLFYDYWLEHVSIQPNTDDSEHELKEKRDSEQVFREIALPPANILRLFVNLEILSARNFTYEPLFVTYNVDLPRHWTIRDEERLTGRTQRSKTVAGCAHFSYVSEIPLDFDLNTLNSVNVQPSWPYLIFTIGSIDSWTRYRIEGYASLPLPSSPGSHNYDLPTWRPIGGFVNVLRRFFTGGTSELEDITYCGIPEAQEPTKKLEKTCLKVAPSGFVRISINVVHQSKMYMKNRMNRDALERLSAGTLINSLDCVLEQFKAARERMIQARAQ